tara:strand:+ start:2411 stop:2644 length:234 start_codon:yes stop_codon:yes gene_type:complete
MVTDEMAKAMEDEYKEQIRLQGRVPMTTKEEYRNADVPMPEDPKDLKKIIRRQEQQIQELRKQLNATLEQFRNKGAI